MQLVPGHTHRALPLVLLALLGLALASPGCRLFGWGKPDATTAKLTEEELHGLLTHWIADFAGRMEDISARLEESPTIDRAERRRIIEWKLRWIPTLQRTTIEQDARRALLDIWGMALLIKESFRSSDWMNEEGEIAKDALEAVSQSVTDVEAIAARLLPPDRLEIARKAVTEFAEKSVTATADLLSDPPSFSASLMSSGGGAVNSVLSIPLSPFRAFEGVSEGAAAIRDFSGVADRFAHYVEALPTYLYWHAQLLLDDLDRTPALVTATESMDRLSKSAEAAVEVANALPASIRKEVETTLDSVMEKQAELRTTIDEVRGAVDSTKELSTSLERVATAAAEAGRAWEGTLATYERIASAPSDKDAEKPTGEPEEPGPTIVDYGDSAEKIGKAAGELRLALEELQTLAGGNELPATLEKLGATADRSVETARLASSELVDRLFVRGLLLVGALILGLLGLRFIPRRS